MLGTESAAAKLRACIAEACQGLVDREALVELVVLCAVTREHMLVLGPPGTAKSEAVRRIARGLGGRYFEYLIGRFTEPSEIFGPINLQRLKEGFVETETRGMLPEAEIAFLDEVFLGSTAILNTLLAILNERTYRRGHTVLSCPLRVCVAASNQLPEEQELQAFADRFLVRLFVEPIGDSGLEALLAGEAVPRSTGSGVSEAMPALDELSAATAAMDLTPLRSTIAHAVRRLRSAGVVLSDRRIVRMQRLFAGAAALAGRSPSAADLWPMIFALPTEAAQELGREVLKELLAESESSALAAAAAESSSGPRARAGRILREGAAVLGEATAEDARNEAWRLRVEGLAREIDATFTPENMPAELAEMRSRIVDVLAPTGSR